MKNVTLPNGRVKQIYAKNSKDWDIKYQTAIDSSTATATAKNKYSKKTFAQITKEYLGAQETWKPQTFIRKKMFWDNEILPTFKNTIVSQLASDDVEEFYKNIESESSIKKVIEVHKVLSSFISWNIEENKCLSSNPLNGGVIKRIKRIDRLEKLEAKSKQSIADIEADETLSLEEVKYVLREVRDTKEEIIYHLQIMHGLRIGEALGMTFENIDLDNNTLHVRQQSSQISLNKIKGTRYEKDINSHGSIRSLKTEESYRQLPLQPATREILLEGEEKTGLVYKNRNGKVMTRTNYAQRYFKPLVKRLGLNISKTHALRGFFASHHFDRGTNPVLIQKMMGHKDLKTTMKHYTKPIIETANKNLYMMSELAI
jgi:integrase